MPVFVQSVLIHAPVERVFGFHERDDALQLLSPAFPPVRVIRKTDGIGEGGGIRKCTRVELKIGPFPWTALHTVYLKNRLFEDMQLEGPFVYWRHRHEFETVGETGDTRLTDRIKFRLPGGPWANLLFGWAVKLGMRQMFRHRHRVTKRYCEGPRR